MYLHKTYSNHQPKVKVGLEVSNFWHEAKQVIKLKPSSFSVKMVQDHIFPSNVQLDCIPSAEISFLLDLQASPCYVPPTFLGKGPLDEMKMQKGNPK